MRTAATLVWTCGTASAACEWPTQMTLEARRFDQRWEPWLVTMRTLALRSVLRGTVEMTSRRICWKLNVSGTLDCVRGIAELVFDTHEPMSMSLLVPTRQGRITSVDDEWILGAPFPKYRR